MVDLEKNSDEPTISTEHEGPSRWETVRAQPWFANVMRLIIAVIVILIIIFVARAIHHHLDNSKTSGPSTAQRPTFKSTPSPTSKNSKTGSKSPSSTTSKSGSKNSAASSGSTSGPSLKSGQQLVNTGPGDIVAIFVATSLAVAGLHLVISARRAF